MHSLVFSMWLLVKREPLTSLKPPFMYWNTVMMFPLILLFLREKDLTPSVISHRAGSPTLLKNFCYPPLDPLQSVHVFLELWGPEMGTILQLWPDRCWVEWDDHISTSACNAPADAVQDPICLFCGSSTLLSPVQLVVHQESQVTLKQGCSPVTWILVCTGLFWPRCRTSHFVRLHTVLGSSSSLYSSLDKLVLSSDVFTSPHSLVSSAGSCQAFCAWDRWTATKSKLICLNSENDLFSCASYAQMYCMKSLIFYHASIWMKMWL